MGNNGPWIKTEDVVVRRWNETDTDWENKTAVFAISSPTAILGQIKCAEWFRGL